MSHPRKAVFLVNLLQDMNIVRPLIAMAARDFGFETEVLMSARFLGRDADGRWQTEVNRVASEFGATQRVYDSVVDALGSFAGGTGLVFAASESSLPAHAMTHDVFRAVPPGFLKVTLQHGFECTGFRHSADHDSAHGQTLTFAADYLCAWYHPSLLTALAASQRSKVLVTGPSTLLQLPSGEIERRADAPGIVCENLHSVRLNRVSDLRTEFVDTLGAFSGLLARDNRTLTLRPHPGGQYLIRQKVALPANCTIDNAPMYRLDLRRFGYGISAPSSVIIDMLLADIPTAVWRDAGGVIDAANYEDLAVVSTPAEWLDFSREAVARPQPFIERQRDFLTRQQMPLDPAEVYRNFAALFEVADRMPAIGHARSSVRERILYVANAVVPTLQLGFLKPLAPLAARGEIMAAVLTEINIKEQFDSGLSDDDVDKWVDEYVARFDPSVIIFCCYSGPKHERILAWAGKHNVPVIYHIDDDLLHVPEDIGVRKYDLHNQPERLATVSSLLSKVELVYTSTRRLKERYAAAFPDATIIDGGIFASGTVMNTPTASLGTKVGYMASADHAPNLEMILPAIVAFMDRHPECVFEIFGSLSLPPDLARFGPRVTMIPAVSDYAALMEEFARRQWDIGLCPLTPIEFNLAKANTKWVEYTAAGVAVIASRDTVYDDCCADGCGILAGGQDEWLAALELLAGDGSARHGQVRRAQNKLDREFSPDQLRSQVIAVIDQAKAIVDRRALQAS